jgi:hypothetical protein
VSNRPGRARLRLYPGLRLPDDCLIVNVIPDTGEGFSWVVLEGEWLPHWEPGFIPMFFNTIEDLERTCAEVIARALDGPEDDNLTAQVQRQRAQQLPLFGGFPVVPAPFASGTVGLTATNLTARNTTTTRTYGV